MMSLDEYLARLRRRLDTGNAQPTARRDSAKPSVEALEERQVLSTAQYHFDFGTATSPLTAGYTRASTEAYSATRGFGWESNTGLTAYNASSGDPLTRDGVQSQSSKNFLIDLPNGDYHVTATLGHPSAKRDTIAIVAEGQQVASGITSTAGSYQRASFNVSVSDGRLNLSFLGQGGANNYFSLSALDVQGLQAPVAAWGFDAGSGTLARDASGNNLNGTLSGATWVNDGKFGKALSFDGVNDWVTVADNHLLDLTTGMTVEAWVKPTAASSDWSTVVLKERPGSLAYALYGADGAGRPPAGYVNLNGTDRNATGAAALPLNQWSHLATTYDGASLKLFVNGTQVGSRAVTGAITTSGGVLRIGGNSVWGEYFTGLIDEVRVYNRALSQSEIVADMGRPVGQPDDSEPPTANAGADRSSNEGSAVSFVGQASGSGLSYLWNFGDGTTATGTLTPTHAYADNGVYTVTLTVTDAQNRTATDTAVVTVANVNPGATLTDNNPVDEGSAVVIAFGNQTDPSSADRAAGYTYSYDFNNDGVWDLVDVTASSTTFTFTDNGTYTVGGRITDKDGGFTDYTTLVEVTNANPTATFTNSGPVLVNNPVTFTFSNASDPSAADTAAGFRYSYDFNNDGIFEVVDSTSASASHTFASAGTYTVRGRIMDKDGGFSDYTTTLTVGTAGSPAPTANAGADKSANEGSAVNFTGTATGDSLVYSWNWGDGTSSAGSLTATHTYADNGVYTVTLTVTDAQDRTASDTAVVTVANVRPTATLSNSGPVNAGSAVTIAFASVSDPSPTDTAAGFRYSYDFNNDGTFEVVDSTSASASHTFASAGTYTVRGRIMDKDGGFTDYTTVVTVNSSGGVLRTLYVSVTGSDSNNGSSASPWRTLQFASNQARAGDLIVIRAGNYTGFNIVSSGTAANRITFRGEVGAIIDTPINFGGVVAGINGSGRQYITIEGLTFTPQAGQGEWYAAIRLGGTPGNWVRGNVIRNNIVQMRTVGVSTTPDKYGLYSSWQDGIVVENNKVSGAYNTGIYTANSSRNYVIRGNEVFNVGGNGIHNNGDLGAGGPGIIYNALIERNIIHNVGFGIGGQAISCDGVQDSRIQNNLLYDIHAKGISLYGTNAAEASKRNLIINNTVLVASDGQVPLRINHNASGNIILNNIFYAATANRAWVDGEESGLVGSTIDYNLTTGVALVGGVRRNDWGSTYGFDAHSVISTNLAAIFVSPSTNDYRLLATSPAVDRGTLTYAPLEDILGNRRPNGGGIDLGAYEW